MEILLYTPCITPRIRYITDYIFCHYLSIDCRLTESVDQFVAYESVKMSYSDQPLVDELFLFRNDLLLQQTIEQQKVQLFTYNDLPAFFEAERAGSAFPFDLFAASFYLMSRYEEYLPYVKDRYGRYAPQDSLAFSGNFLEKPLVNSWAQWLLEKLVERYPQVHFPPKRMFDYIPTYDIDHPYAFLYRPWYMNLGGFVRNLFHGHFDAVQKRLLTLLRLQKDPYDSYDFQFALQKKFGFRPHYFILCAKKRNRFENRFNYRHPRIRRLVRRIAQQGEVGIHPSVASNSDKQLFENEMNTLAGIIQTPVSTSRQHYLMLKLPQTYRVLLANGINEDYSMGYAGMPGFRASVSTPFYWFDLEKNETTSLIVYPIAYMEVSLNDYLELSPSDAHATIFNLIDNVKAVNGLFVSLWHNNSLRDSGHWRGWKKVYTDSIAYADSLKKKNC
jgi:hypothetical protein